MADPDIQVTVEGREATPLWHLRVVLVVIIVLAVAYEVAVHMVLQ